MRDSLMRGGIRLIDRLMGPESKPARLRLSRSDQSTSTPQDDAAESQLSEPDGVERDVGTAALDRGMLMGAGTQQFPAAFSPSMTGGELLSDAQIMLRAKA